MTQNQRTHIPGANVERNLFDLRMCAVHVLQLLNELTEVLSLTNILKHIRLQTQIRYFNIQATIVGRTKNQLFNCTTEINQNTTVKMYAKDIKAQHIVIKIAVFIFSYEEQ